MHVIVRGEARQREAARHSPRRARSAQSARSSLATGHSKRSEQRLLCGPSSVEAVSVFAPHASSFTHVRGQVLRIQTELFAHSPSVPQYLAQEHANGHAHAHGHARE